jgi:hypothetical protein
VVHIEAELYKVAHHNQDSSTDSLCRFACPLHPTLGCKLLTVLLGLLSSVLVVFAQESVFQWKW